jgi:hypothetical protein
MPTPSSNNLPEQDDTPHADDGRAPTPAGSSLPANQDVTPRAQGFDLLRTATFIVGGAIGAILAITVLSAWRDTGAVATAAISAISAIRGALIGVFALEVGRHNRQ